MYRKWFCSLSVVLLLSVVSNTKADNANEVDATSIRNKVLCGYQGWFRCPTDGFGLRWHHWSTWGSGNIITPDSLTFEMWPDMTEYSKKYEVTGFTYPNGEQAHLYSAVDYSTVLRHFEWMENYGIDGVWLQRFLVGLNFDIGGSLGERFRAAMLQVLNNVQNAASQTGRVWALAYDMAEMPTNDIVDYMIFDWKNLVDQGITDDPHYLHHNGKPVLALWEFNLGARPNVTATVANQLIDFFKNNPVYGVFLVGGCQWNWRSVEDENWAAIFRGFDAICPWNVGNTVTENGKKWANTNYWQKDKTEAENAGMLYLPVVYPGFSWDNLQNLPPGTSIIPRQGGKFYWKQYHKAAELGLDMVYVAMFDEVDEGTAIYKVTNQPPEQAHFVTYEGFPSDWYLRLTAEGTKMLRGERAITSIIPIGYSNPYGPVENLNTGKKYDYIQHAIIDANDGDVIVAEPAVYFENISFENKNLTVRSVDSNNPDIVTTTVINGENEGSVVTFAGSEDANCVLAGFTITNGYAHQGGGVYNDSGCPILTNCTFISNSAEDDGAAVFNRNGDLTIKNCVFINNSAVDAGGGIKNESASPTITNCMFIRNTAAEGGGIYNRNQSNPKLMNCTFSRNSAEIGGGIRNFKSSPALTNCILWNNWPNQIKNRDSSSSVVYSDIQGSWPGTGNINADPCFFNPDSNDFHLLPDSPCINAGDPNFIAEANETDIDGELRVMLGRVDMGVDEFNPFEAVFDVVDRRRVDRTVFEYDCEVTLTNISHFAVRNVQLEIVKASENMVITEPNVTFGDVEIGAGESASSIDTCSFQVDRSQAIGPAEIIWWCNSEMVDTGQTMQLNDSSIIFLEQDNILADGTVDFEDLAALAEQWLRPPGTPSADIAPQPDGDGIVNFLDFALFAENWMR